MGVVTVPARLVRVELAPPKVHAEVKDLIAAPRASLHPRDEIVLVG